MIRTVAIGRGATATAGLAAGLLLAVGLSGCSSKSSPAPAAYTTANAYGAGTAEDAIRSFLDAAAAQEYSRMRRLFGTKDGPAEESWGVQEVEQRMVVLSGMLLHQSYSLRPLELGYIREDQKGFVATIIGTRYGNVNVPITAVRTMAGRWFVEQLGMDSLTGDSS